MKTLLVVGAVSAVWTIAAGYAVRRVLYARPF